MAGTQSIDRALTLLSIAARHHAQGISLGELVEAAQLDRTTTYRIVSSLVRAGLLSREGLEGRYRLGLETVALGQLAMTRSPLVERCRPVMMALARRTGDHVFLVVRSGDYSHCLHLEEGSRPVKGFAETVGSTRLLGQGVPSFTLLACMADDAIHAHYVRHQMDYKAYNLTESRLMRWVRQTREHGYAQIIAKGLGGIGVRFDVGSCADAALGVLTAASRMPRARGPDVAQMAREELCRFGWNVS
ncbi:IclR family transcriptional regulator [Comamonas humi]